MKKQFLYLLFGFLTIACGGGDDNVGVMTGDTPIGMDDYVVSDVEAFDISIPSTVINSFQIIELGIPGDIQLTQNTYQALFGSEEITLTLNDNKSLSFMAPDIQSGDYIFSIQIGNKKGLLDFKLSQIEDVENVVEFLNQELFNPLNKSKDEANSALENPDILDEERTLIEQGNEFYNAAVQSFENLTSNEKQQFSKLLIANEISFLIDETTGKSSSKTIFDWAALDAEELKLVNARIQLSLMIGAVILVLNTPEPIITKVIAVLAGAYGVYTYRDVLTIRKSIIDRIIIPVENFIEAFSNKSSSFVSKNQYLNFINDTPSDFSVTSTGRRIIRSDEDYPDSRISNAVKEINETDNKRNELKRTIDQLLDSIGSFFNLGNNQIEETSGLPESMDAEIMKLDLGNFSIENQPEDFEVSVSILNQSTLQIKFISETNMSAQFVADLIYDDGDFRTETALNINLEGNPENSEGFFTDSRDGEVYKWVRINEKKWFAENLRYVGTIPEVSSTNAWSNMLFTGQSAWCYYNNNSNLNSTYGKLYTWNAANLNICPDGWHIPSDSEWVELINSITSDEFVSFGLLAGGYRNTSGIFNYFGSNSFWWSSTSNPSDSRAAYNRNLSLARGNFIKSAGQYCRCIEDN